MLQRLRASYIPSENSIHSLIHGHQELSDRRLFLHERVQPIGGRASWNLTVSPIQLGDDGVGRWGVFAEPAQLGFHAGLDFGGFGVQLQESYDVLEGGLAILVEELSVGIADELAWRLWYIAAIECRCRRRLQLDVVDSGNKSLDGTQSQGLAELCLVLSFGRPALCSLLELMIEIAR